MSLSHCDCSLLMIVQQNYLSINNNKIQQERILQILHTSQPVGEFRTRIHDVLGTGSIGEVGRANIRLETR